MSLSLDAHGRVAERCPTISFCVQKQHKCSQMCTWHMNLRSRHLASLDLLQAPRREHDGAYQRSGGASAFERATHTSSACSGACTRARW